MSYETIVKDFILETIHTEKKTPSAIQTMILSLEQQQKQGGKPFSVDESYVKTIIETQYRDEPDMRLVKDVLDYLFSLYTRDPSSSSFEQQKQQQPPSPLFPLLQHEVMNLLHQLTLIPVSSAIGYTAFSDFLSFSKAFVIKTPRENPQNDYNLDMLYEYFIGTMCTNRLRQWVPNFMYTFSLFECNSLPFIQNQEKNGIDNSQICASTQRLRYYLVLEKIEGQSLSSFLTQATIHDYSRILRYMFQILMALQIAQDKYSFVHSDLHTGNILLRPSSLRSKEIVQYELDGVTYEIETDLIPTMIDFGYSHFIYRGIPLGIVPNEQYGVDPIATMTGIDMYKLIMGILVALFLHRQYELFDAISWILDYYADKEDMYGVQSIYEREYKPDMFKHVSMRTQSIEHLNEAMTSMAEKFMSFEKSAVRLMKTSPRDLFAWMKQHKSKLWGQLFREYPKTIPLSRIEQEYHAKWNLYSIFRLPPSLSPMISCTPHDYQSWIVNQYTLSRFQSIQSKFSVPFSPSFVSSLRQLKNQNETREKEYKKNDTDYEQKTISELKSIYPSIHLSELYHELEQCKSIPDMFQLFSHLRPVDAFLSIYDQYHIFFTEYAERFQPTSIDQWYYGIKHFRTRVQQIWSELWFRNLEIFLAKFSYFQNQDREEIRSYFSLPSSKEKNIERLRTLYHEMFPVLQETVYYFPDIRHVIPKMESSIVQYAREMYRVIQQPVYLPPRTQSQFFMVQHRMNDIHSLLQPYLHISNSDILSNLLTIHQNDSDDEIFHTLEEYRNPTLPCSCSGMNAAIVEPIVRDQTQHDISFKHLHIGWEPDVREIANRLGLNPKDILCVCPLFLSSSSSSSSSTKSENQVMVFDKSLPFPDKMFSSVTCFQVLHYYTEQVPPLLSEIYRVMKPTGVFLLQEYHVNTQEMSSSSIESHLMIDLEHTLKRKWYYQQIHKDTYMLRSQIQWVDIVTASGFIPRVVQEEEKKSTSSSSSSSFFRPLFLSVFQPITPREKIASTTTTSTTAISKSKPNISLPPQPPPPLQKQYEWKTERVLDLSDQKLQELFTMYKTSYEQADQEVWLSEPTQLRTYTCSVMSIEKGGKTVCALMYRNTWIANKISLICHDGTREGKDMMMEKISKLVQTPGWIIEASGGVSWVLRNTYRLSPIRNESIIRRVLNLNRKRNQDIQMNPKFRMEDKHQQVYTHIYYDYQGRVKYQNQESMFGIECLRFSQQGDLSSCSRRCISPPFPPER